MNETPKVSIRPEDVKPEEAKWVLSILNAAEEAQQLADVIEIPGRRDVGISTARSILDRRNQLGGFKSLSELASVPQVGPVRFSQIITALRQSSQQGGRIAMEKLRQNKNSLQALFKSDILNTGELGELEKGCAGGH